MTAATTAPVASSAGPTEALARFIADLRFEDLPNPVVRAACDVILDTVGCALGAWSDDPDKGRVVRGLCETFKAASVAAIWGDGGYRTDAALAAFANGVLANAADFDDTHKRALLHTGSVVVPTVLALAEELALSGKEVVTAVVAGYETAVRVGMAVMPTHYRFWHSTATNGTFGAAAAAARALKLTPEQARMALGFAGTQAAGLNTFFTSGDFTKSLHPGKAAMNGILAARLAALGATSPPTMLEHEKGYLAAFSLEPNVTALARGLGSEWEILQNGFKYFPSILASHAAIQAALDVVTAHTFSPADVVAITNETYATVKTHFSAKSVSTVMGARVSVPYCVAIAVLDHAVGPAQFALSRVRSAEAQAMLALTEVVAVPELTALYPDKFPARVTIALKDGRRLTAMRHFPKGDPQEPLTPAEIEAKFLANAAACLDGSDAQRAAALMRALPEQAGLTALMHLLARAVPVNPAR